MKLVLSHLRFKLGRAWELARSEAKTSRAVNREVIPINLEHKKTLQYCRLSWCFFMRIKELMATELRCLQ